MNCCKHKYFVIFRGDDTDFPGNQELVIEIDTTRDLTGCSAHFSFQGFVQDFAEIPADRKLRLVIPNSETCKFALGAADARLWLTNGQKIRTVENRIHIVVTNRVEEAYDNDDPQAITVTISGGGGGSTVVLDDTVTEESQNGVKSSGIWSWVKSLLPRWLTSDYAEPATVASVSAKADRSELGGYLPLSGGSLSGKVDGQGWWLDSGCLYLGDGLLIGGDNRPVSISTYGNAYLLNDADGHKWFYGDPDEQDNEIAVKGDISALEHSLAEKLPSVLSKTDTLSVENPEPLALPIPMIEYTVLDLVTALKGWIWNGYVKFANLRGKPTTLAGYGITDAATKADVDEKANSADVPGMVRETMSAEGISSSGINIGGPVSGQTVRDQYGDLREAINGKVGSFESVGGATATVENGVAKLDDFFTDSNSLLTGTIDARLPYPLYSVPSTGLLKDRAINTTSLASVTVPENFTDLLVRASVASSLSVTMPESIAAKYGDTFPGEAGEYLITITKTGAAEAYVRTIKLEEVANA